MNQISLTLAALLPVLFFASDDPQADRWEPRGEWEDRLATASCVTSDAVARPVGSSVSFAEPPGHRPAAVLDFGSPDDFRPAPGWQISLSRPGFAMIPDEGAPASPPYVARATYPPGFGDGVSPVWAEKDISDLGFTRLYVCLWVKLSENWQGHDSGVNKISFVWSDGRPKVVLAAVGSDDAQLRPQVRLQDLPSSSASARNLEPNLASAPVERGRWHRMELLVVANRGAVPDGQAHWWVDGVKVGEYRDIAYVGPSSDPRWERVAWRPIWGGRGDAVRETQNMWLDHLYVSGAP